MDATQVLRRSAATLTAATIAVGGGMAVASWLQTATGPATAKATTAQVSVITAGTAAADLYPGKTDGALSGKVTNPNPYPVSFTDLSAGAITVDAGHPGCTTTGVSLTTTTLATPIDVPANSTGTDFSLPVVAMSNSSSNGCQGATFSIALTLTGASA